MTRFVTLYTPARLNTHSLGGACLEEEFGVARHVRRSRISSRHGDERRHDGQEPFQAEFPGLWEIINLVRRRAERTKHGGGGEG